MSIKNSRPDGGRRVNRRAVLVCTSAAAVATVAAALAAGCSEHNSGSALDEHVATQAQALVTPGVWTTLPTPYPSGGGIGQIQLLMDGSILANDSASVVWRRYFPDPVSGYVGGHWEQVASSISEREYFATGLLRDGRFLICGGEHASTNGVPDGDSSKCEVYDPNVNFPSGQWQSVADAPQAVGDGFFSVRADGKLMLAPGIGNTMYLYDPSANPVWVASGTVPSAIGTFNEGALTRLQNDKLFFTRNLAATYTPGGGASAWSSTIALPANSTFGGTYHFGDPKAPPVVAGQVAAVQDSVESGAALTLYDGRVFIGGSQGHNAIYNPATNSVTQVADTPGQFSNVHKFENVGTACTTNANCQTGQVCGGGTGPKTCYIDHGLGIGNRLDESAQSVLPNGHVLAAVVQWDFGVNFSAPSSPTCGSGSSPPCFTFYEYEPDGAFTALPGAPVFGPGSNVVQTLLPDGGALVANNTSANLYIYSHAGAQQTAFGQPTITSVSGPVGGVYTLTGTSLNGLTNGSNRDDEGQAETGFPIVWINTYGQRRYCTVTSVNSGSIKPGTSVTVQFKLPPNVPTGSFTLGISASGLQGANTIAFNTGVPANVAGPDGLLLLE